MPKPVKIEQVSELTADLQNSTALLLTDYRGLKVSEVAVLRNKLRGLDAEYKVVKNTLFLRAAEERGQIGLAEVLAGPTAVVFVKQDPVGPAKALVDFMKEHKALKIKGGYVDGCVYDGVQIQALSKVPPRDVLIAQMVGSIQAPLSNMVGTLQGVLSGLVFTLKAVADQKAA